MILDDKQDAVTDPGASIRQVTPEPSRKRPAPPVEPPRPSVRISLLYLSSNANSLLQKAAAKGKEVRYHPTIPRSPYLRDLEGTAWTQRGGHHL